MELDEKAFRVTWQRYPSERPLSKRLRTGKNLRIPWKKSARPCIESLVVHDVEAAVEFSDKIGYPVIVRPACITLGGTGGGIADDEEELREIMFRRTSPVARKRRSLSRNVLPAGKR